MDRDNPWSRRTNSKSTYTKAESQTRGFPSRRHISGDSSSRSNGLPSLNTNVIPQPGAASAFGLGSGAFAAFGSSLKTPKTAAPAYDLGKDSSSSASPPAESERPALRSTSKNLPQSTSKEQVQQSPDPEGWPLKYIWVMWYRPPAVSKNQDYEKSIKPVYKMATAQEFWRTFTHLKRPSALPIVSDYHFFKDSIRPVWEDEANKRGGKWIMRFKKGVMDRYWEEILLATIGDQFVEAGEEVCGMVVSVRNGEDVLSVWTRNNGGRNVKIRETIKRVLNLPADTNIIWKSHDDSIAQKSLVEQARQEKGSEKRRNTLAEIAVGGKDKET